MRLSRIAFTISCLVLMAAVISSAGPLKKRHQIELKLGMWNQAQTQAEVDITSVSTSIENNGLLVSLSYGHWLEEHVALTMGIEVMSAEFSTETALRGVSTEISAVVPVLMGMKFYYPIPGSESSIRPYGKLSVGPFVGSQSNTNVSLNVAVEERTEVAFGGQVAAGIDFVLGRNVHTGLALAYNLMADFEESIGGRKNYSGPTFGFGLSFVFGKGVN